MLHPAIELFYFAAFGVFLLGSAFSFRDNGSPASLAVMTCGVLGDMVLRLLPLGGFTDLPANMGVTNPFIYQAVIIGMLTIWPAYIFALLFRRQGRMWLFHWLIAVIELVWFLDIVLLLYGLYVFFSLY